MLESRTLGWTVYIVEGERGALYTGITTSVARRFAEHAGHRGRGARFFRTQRPRDLVYVEVAADRGGALRREAEIKRLARSRKLALIAAQRAVSP
jgi:putative endonuclease